MNRDVVGRYFKLDAYPRNFSEPIAEKNIALLFAIFGKMVNEVLRRYGEK